MRAEGRLEARLMVLAYNFRIQEAEAGEPPGVESQPGFHSEFQANLGYRPKPLSPITKEKIWESEGPELQSR